MSILKKFSVVFLGLKWNSFFCTPFKDDLSSFADSECMVKMKDEINLMENNQVKTQLIFYMSANLLVTNGLKINHKTDGTIDNHKAHLVENIYHEGGCKI